MALTRRGPGHAASVWSSSYLAVLWAKNAPRMQEQQLSSRLLEETLLNRTSQKAQVLNLALLGTHYDFGQVLSIRIIPN